jgi:hypothetical protein
MKLEKSKFTLTDSDVAAFEEKRGIRLPADYRDFLLESNGGSVDGEDLLCFVVSPEQGEASMAFFYSLKDAPRSTWTLDYANNLCTPRLPATLLVVGAEGTGGKICIGIAGPESGKVYFWDPGMDVDETSEGSFDNIHEIAGSFSEFRQNLKPLGAFE